MPEFFVQDATDAVQGFIVNSLDWRALSDNGGSTAALVGYLGGAGTGTEIWRIEGPQDLDPPTTFFAPTSGSFGDLVDSIAWEVPDYLDGTFGQTLDNVSVNIGGGAPIGSQRVFDFESNTTNFGFNGLTTQTVDGVTIEIDFGNLCDRNPGGACGDGDGNGFVFGESGPAGLTQLITVTNEAGANLPFRLESIDFANIPADLETTLAGQDATFTDVFSTVVGPNVSEEADDFDITQTEDGAGGQLNDHVLTSFTLTHVNNSDPVGQRFPSIDNIVIDLNLADPPGVVGDFDGDGDVDGADFLEWQRTDGTPGGLADFRNGFGSGTLTGAATAVPEPTTLMLISLGLLFGQSCRRRNA